MFVRPNCSVLCYKVERSNQYIIILETIGALTLIKQQQFLL